MAKRRGALSGKKTKSRSHKTKKRLAIKAVMLAERAAKRLKRRLPR